MPPTLFPFTLESSSLNLSLPDRLCCALERTCLHVSFYVKSISRPTCSCRKFICANHPNASEMKQSGKHSETTLAARRPTFTQGSIDDVLSSILGRYSVTSLLAMHTQPQSHRIGSAHRLPPIPRYEMILRSTVTSGGTL